LRFASELGKTGQRDSKSARLAEGIKEGRQRPKQVKDKARKGGHRATEEIKEKRTGLKTGHYN
jgi:hypothetical protein